LTQGGEKGEDLAAKKEGRNRKSGETEGEVGGKRKNGGEFNKKSRVFRGTEKPPREEGGDEKGVKLKKGTSNKKRKNSRGNNWETGGGKREG